MKPAKQDQSQQEPIDKTKFYRKAIIDRQTNTKNKGSKNVYRFNGCVGMRKNYDR